MTTLMGRQRGTGESGRGRNHLRRTRLITGVTENTTGEKERAGNKLKELNN